jgi:hypothetical protein
MDKHTAPSTTNPNWWSDKHNSAWDRAREALHRDWEQTKSDFSSKGGVDLNQNVGDTVKQMAGAAGVPPLTVKTRPDTPEEAANRIAKDLEQRQKALGNFSEARTETAVVQVKADGKVAQERHDSLEKIDKEQQKLGAIAKDARETIAKDERKAQEKQDDKIDEVRAKADEKIADVRKDASEAIAKQQEKVTEARRDWSQVEPAVRYGYGARMAFPDTADWDSSFESRLRNDWNALGSGSTWEQSRSDVRHGWDSARRTNHS